MLGEKSNGICLLWKQTVGSPEKLNIELLYDPAIPVLGTDPKKLKTGTQASACVGMFPAPVTIAEGENELCYVHTVEHHQP